jgi:hypothetical protein
MRKGFTAFSANNDVDLAKASAVAADILMKRRRLVFMVGDYERRFILLFNNEPAQSGEAD